MIRPPHLRTGLPESKTSGVLAGGALSAALHIGVLALLVGIGGGEDTAPVPVLSVELIDSRTLHPGPAIGDEEPAAPASPAPPPAEQASSTDTASPAEQASPAPLPEPAEPVPPELAEASAPEPPPPPAPSGEPADAAPSTDPVESTEAALPPQPAPPPPARKPPAPDPAPPPTVRQPEGRPHRESPPSAPSPSAPATAADSRSSAMAAATPPGAAPQGPTQGARAVNSPPPRYPVVARRRGQQGRVVLRVHVAASGVPESVELVESSGVGALDNAAADAVRTWRFSPALRNGIAVAAMLDVPVRFRLDED